MNTYPSARNIDRLTGRVVSAVSLVAVCALSSCATGGADSNEAPKPPSILKEFGAAHNNDVVGYFDKQYASDGCFENSPYDPRRTDGGPEAVLTGDENSEYLMLYPAGVATVIEFQIVDGTLLPDDYASGDSTMKYNYRCDIPR